MSKYYFVVQRWQIRGDTSDLQSSNDFKSLFKALSFIYSKRFFQSGMYSYRYTIERRYGWELVEKSELKRLKNKYESKQQLKALDGKE